MNEINDNHTKHKHQLIIIHKYQINDNQLKKKKKKRLNDYRL